MFITLCIDGKTLSLLFKYVINKCAILVILVPLFGANNTAVLLIGL